MAQVRILFLALAALALAGCGKNVCEKLADGYYDYRTAGLGCSYTIPSVKIGDACAVTAGQCDGNDTTLLEEYATCIGEIAKCEAGKEQEFADAETKCYEKLAALSDGCAPALSMVCTTSTNQAYSLVDAYDNLSALAGECTTDAAPTAEQMAALMPLVTWEDCLRGMDKCTHKDIDALETYTKCLVALDPCEDGSEQAFLDAAGACNTALALSQECMSALKVPAVTQ